MFFDICAVIIPLMAFTFGLGFGYRTTQIILGTAPARHGREHSYGPLFHDHPPRRYWRRK